MAKKFIYRYNKKWRKSSFTAISPAPSVKLNSDKRIYRILRLQNAQLLIRLGFTDHENIISERSASYKMNIKVKIHSLTYSIRSTKFQKKDLFFIFEWQSQRKIDYEKLNCNRSQGGNRNNFGIYRVIKAIVPP